MSADKAVAFDLSLMSSGVAFADGSCKVIKGLGPKIDEQVRMAYLFEEFSKVLREAGELTAVYKEAPFIRRVGAGSVPLLMVHGVFAAAVVAECGDIPLFQVSPTALKKWATGDGTADKNAMIDAAQWRGYEGSQNDEADAFLVFEYFKEHRV